MQSPKPWAYNSNEISEGIYGVPFVKRLVNFGQILLITFPTSFNPHTHCMPDRLRAEKKLHNPIRYMFKTFITVLYKILINSF